jgi:hypothetical protein
MSNQDFPIQTGHDDADVEQKIAGLVAQTRADFLQGTTTDAATDLQQRLIQSGIEVDRERFEALVATVTG